MQQSLGLFGKLRSLDQRHRQPEIMDDPGLDPRLLNGTLTAIERINRLSRSANILWGPIEQLARELGGRPISVLDIACGGGDVTVALAKRARRSGVEIQLSGCDISQTALDTARRKAITLGVHVDFFKLDVVNHALPGGFDVMTSSLFLHHLDELPAIDLLRRIGHAVGHLLLVNDLRRCRAGYLAAWIGCHVLSRSRVAHVDGPRSVEGAFTIAEARQLAEQSGLTDAHIENRWPWRFLLEWRK